jgi:hypothetical protein
MIYEHIIKIILKNVDKAMRDILLREILQRRLAIYEMGRYRYDKSSRSSEIYLGEGNIPLLQILRRLTELSLRWNDIITIDFLEVQRTICHMERYY